MHALWIHNDRLHEFGGPVNHTEIAVVKKFPEIEFGQGVLMETGCIELAEI